MPADTSEESSDNSAESSSGKPKDKWVSITGSALTVYCANKSPDNLELSAQEQRALSVNSSHFVFLIFTTSQFLLVSLLFKETHRKYRHIRQTKLYYNV